MKELHNLQLPQSLSDALQAARDRISAEFSVDRIVLFGSAVRGEVDEESDVDLLVVLKDQPDHKMRNRISNIILDINLEYDTNLSEIIVNQQEWDHGPLSILPIHQVIEEAGIPL